jgi:cobalt-zinc-cadmium efflux system membrane fusion protein
VNRTLRNLLIALLAGAAAGLGLTWAHPGWLPAWVSRARPSAVGAQDDDGAAGPAEESGREANRIVRLASAALARRLGIETAPVARERRAEVLTANAEAAYDARHAAEVLARVAGVVREVRADLGQVVGRGDVLAVVDSAQVGSAKVRLHTARAAVELARATYDRTRALTREKAAPAKAELEHLIALNQARSGLMEAEQALRNLGFPDTDLARIARDDDASNLLEVAAPIAGTVTAWDATPGEAVEPTTQLFALADTSRMWLWIDVYEADVARVAPGQPVAFSISGAEWPAVSGRVTAVGTEVDPVTRTTRVRAELANPDGRLRAHQYGRATIQVAPERDTVVIPRAAVQRDGPTELVFLPLDDRSFQPQPVATRPTDRDDLVEVLRGLEPGQRVVTTRSYLLKSELFRDRLGAADND